ncbi:g5476 [Coccomyxa viridis]|uniref:G5476 protein n=1 Tax=Coccomyxa viridis TaxID=1274662 RepID=A0ABP1FSY2_9CHLO
MECYLNLWVTLVRGSALHVALHHRYCANACARRGHMSAPPPPLRRSQVTALAHSRNSYGTRSPITHSEDAEDPRTSRTSPASDSDAYELTAPQDIHFSEIGPSRNTTVGCVIRDSKLNVNKSPAGLGNFLGWDRRTSEVALYERRGIGIRELTLVGVFPVMDGYAHLDLRAVAGKGRTQYNPLYIIPGRGGFLSKVPGLGWAPSILLDD